ncbi:MAG TPA: hypothetical protein VMB35_07470 [Methanomicrobiales archaeon]|nr:hypothetical protein [Methanomicrobiales archaeon]
MVKATFGLEENVASALCYVLLWVTGIIFLLVEKENKTVKFHAWQSIATFLPLQILTWILGFLFVGIYFFGLYWIIWLIDIIIFILWLVLMYKAYSGEKFMVPIAGAFAASQVK